MKKLLVPLALAAFGLGAALPAHSAVMLSDHQHVGKTLWQGQSHTVTHDFSPQIPGQYQATHGFLVLTFFNGHFHDNATLRVGGAPAGSLTIGSWFDIEYRWLNGGMLDALNLAGTLDVTIKALSSSYWKDSFHWKSSLLKVKATPVPEPGMLALLGAGLLGVALLRVRRRSAHATAA